MDTLYVTKRFINNQPFKNLFNRLNFLILKLNEFWEKISKLISDWVISSLDKIYCTIQSKMSLDS